MNDDDLTVKEAAELLGVTTTAILNLISRGVLVPARKFGRAHVLRRRDVLAHLARRGGKQKPGPRQGVTRAQTASDVASDGS